eukprot:TRINITY_DN11803_c0_g1_i2.p1 TRINITY_DN11803_c0_g1~~TRINITY_DN11803_c0_g1_i2.p1  ORF type:complete len:166 (-),score=24.10 TRINITY_DN11803_c0_g1_i2:39-485(-)
MSTNDPKHANLQISTSVLVKVGSKTVYPGSPTYDNWHLNKPSSWISHTNPADEFVEFKIIQPVYLYGAVLQGRTDYDQWLTEVEIFTSRDGLVWVSQGFFAGCHDRNTPTLLYFTSPVLASRIKFTNFKFQGHMSCRFGVVIKECGRE